mmetsp:Transcript_13298/g.19059  ORF Transcript_13298/g.19059 Transcript_13298/m.19059 type:complete len:131 (-) Transcript_13298:142-534(-)
MSSTQCACGPLAQQHGVKGRFRAVLTPWWPTREVADPRRALAVREKHVPQGALSRGFTLLGHIHIKLKGSWEDLDIGVTTRRRMDTGDVLIFGTSAPAMPLPRHHPGLPTLNRSIGAAHSSAVSGRRSHL